MNPTLFRTRAAEVTAMSGVAAGQAGFAVMHLTQSGAVDPVATPVSSYALTWPGIALFPLSVLSMALVCAILAGRGVGLAREGSVRFLLGATAVMLVCAAVFRTGTPESGLTWWAQIHRYSAGTAFVLLTVVAALCAARMRGTGAPEWARRGTWWAAALSAAMFATTTVNTFLPDLADGGDWRGIPQRMLLAVLSALLWILVANSIRAAAAPAPAAVAVPVADAVPALAGSRS